jgi:hypothetical protein
MTFRILISFAFTVLSTQLYSQYILDTPDGKKVKLNKDGTWTYLVIEPTFNKGSVILPKGSTSKFISRQKKYSLWFDPSQWFYDTTKKVSSLWDATFYSMDKAITGFCLESRLSMPMDNLEELIRQQWESSGEIISYSSHKDTINNLEVALVNMQLLYGGLTYQYRGIINSTNKGSFQFLVGTQKEIFTEDETKINQLLKGLIRN